MSLGRSKVIQYLNNTVLLIDVPIHGKDDGMSKSRQEHMSCQYTFY